MSKLWNKLCVREDAETLKSLETSRWRVVSTFEDDIDVSQYRSGRDIAIALGDILMRHLNAPMNPMGMKRIIGGPAYTYGSTSATATIFFEGMLSPLQTGCMKVCSHCEWADDKVSD